MFKAKKSLGQNFLVNPHILDKIVFSAGITKNDIILEVGPGTGLLTKKLADNAGRVIAVEKDRRLISVLKETFKNYPNVEIVEGDVLKFTPNDLQLTTYKIVANIPYYITSNFLRTVFEEWPTPQLIVLTIQKEVALRIMALPAQAGKPPHMNLLALSVQYYCEPEIIGIISKNNFRPVPKIDSAIIKLRPKSVIQNPQFFNLIKIGFSEKRKQLANLLSKNLKITSEKITETLEKAGISSKARAENLSLEQWDTLNKLLST